MGKFLSTQLDKREMLQQLEGRKIDFSPFELKSVHVPRDRSLSAEQTQSILIELNWADSLFRFAVENRIRSNSLQIVKIAIEQALRHAKETASHPMVYLPYLSKNAVQMLAEMNVSGFDLCGNLFIIVPDKVYIERIGRPNRFTESVPIKNIYQKNSSLVPRLFLLQPSFDSISAIVDELKRRKGVLTQATVSKICKQLEEDLILDKKRVKSQTKTYLIQPESILSRLSECYARPIIKRRLMMKSRMSKEQLTERLRLWSDQTGNRIVYTGATSCTAYTVMAREETVVFYCSDLERLLSDFDGFLEETKRFADIELLETVDQFVYFDQRGIYASPIQSYLELIQGDKRDRQASETIAKTLLKNVRILLDSKENESHGTE